MSVSSRPAALPILSLFLLVVFTDAFTPGLLSRHHDVARTASSTQLHATKPDNRNRPRVSRKDFVSTSILSLGSFLINRQSALAQDADVMMPTITACKVVPSGKPTNCVSTASVRQVDCYAPPWTFEVSPDEAMARLKGIIASDPSLTLVQEVSPSYLVVSCNRPPLDVKDEIQFFINAQDKVVTFKSYETGEPSVSDFGANRKRLETLRKKANVFGVMGEGMTADSYGDRGTGPLQQLKAFYGLQSGEGYEEVFED